MGRIPVIALAALGTLAAQSDKRMPAGVLYFSGSVMVDGGTVPADPVRIERVCEGHAQFEAWTDSRGHFSFKMAPGGTDQLSADANMIGGPTDDPTKSLGNGTHPLTLLIPNEPRGCELRGVLAGYRSETVPLSSKSMSDETRIGTIILYPVSRASALTVSTTTLQAPSNARKAYEKGLEAMRLQKWDGAAADFAKAVKIYPKFAVAWYQLGVARQNLKDAAGAVEAWKEAQSSDPKYLNPYESLTAAADRRGDWAESEKYSRLWVALDTEEFPLAYLFNAVANAHLDKPEDSEKAVREGLRIDKDQRVARLHYVLGVILMEKKQYSDSARCFRKYLELAPKAGDANAVRQQLPKLEELAAASRAK